MRRRRIYLVESFNEASCQNSENETRKELQDKAVKHYIKEEKSLAEDLEELAQSRAPHLDRVLGSLNPSPSTSPEHSVDDDEEQKSSAGPLDLSGPSVGPPDFAFNYSLTSGTSAY